MSPGVGRDGDARVEARAAAQGTADTIVTPDVTERLVRKLCDNGETVKLRLYPGVTHIEAGHDAAPDVLNWIGDRFAGQPAPTSCT
jgi:hypothetical protein